MKILLVEPGKEAREFKIDGSLKAMQDIVGGSIQVVYPYEDLVGIVCNEEGKLAGLPFSRGLQDENGELCDVVSGSFFVCGLGEEDFTDLSPELMDKYKTIFLEPEVLLEIDGKVTAMKIPAEKTAEAEPLETVTMNELMTMQFDEPIFSAYITNLGKYVEGELAGEWVGFPTTKENIQGVLKQIGVDGIRYEEMFITDYESSEFSGLTKHFGEHSNIDELNFLASKVAELSDWQKEVYTSALASDVSSVEAAINLTENLDCYCLYSGVFDDSELGYYYLEEAGIYDLENMGNLKNYIDYEKFGQDVRIEEGGFYTDNGYVYMQNNHTDFYHSGQEIPDEYKIFAFPERPVKNAPSKEEQSHER